MVDKITTSSIIELYLNDYGKAFYLRELASFLGRPHQSIRQYIDKLVGARIFIEERRRNFVEYKLNWKNVQIYDYLVISEKEKLLKFFEKDILLKVLFEKLSDFFKDNSFIVFGSSVDGTKKNSDIDLLVVGKSKINKEIKEFEEIYNKKIHKVQISNLDKLSATLIKEIYKKHLIFNDTENVVRFFGGLHEQNKLV